MPRGVGRGFLYWKSFNVNTNLKSFIPKKKKGKGKGEGSLWEYEASAEKHDLNTCSAVEQRVDVNEPNNSWKCSRERVYNMTCEIFSATNRFSVIFVNIYNTFLVRHTFVIILWATFKLLSSFWTTAVSLLASTIVWRSKKTEEEEATTSSGQVQGGSSETWSQSSFCWMTTSKVFLQNFTKSRVNLTFDLFRIRKCHHVDFLSHGQKTYFCEVTMPPWPLTPDHPVLIRSSWSPSGCLCQIQSVPEKFKL